ncbi:MAG: hypothetical protein EOM26_01695 [Alphaproteobacteria bacterium]|nr:hypothetical protein [Alphaproteobacteria bacterium]
MVKKHLTFGAMLFCATLLLASPDAAAIEKTSRLTDDIVRRFIIETTDVTSRKDAYMSDDEVKNYLDRHLHKKGFFKSAIRYVIPGFPSQENTMSLDKKQFIESVMSGQQALEDYRTDVSIEEIRISSDGEKATVVTRAAEEGLMPVPSESGGDPEKIPVEGNSTCNQILMLEDRVIQMYSANCTTQINFRMPF